MQKRIITEELINEGRKYFILSKAGINMKYIGPKGEYQKWYHAVKKEMKSINTKKWRLKNIEHDRLNVYLIH